MFKLKCRLLVIMLIIFLLINYIVPIAVAANYNLGDDIQLRGYGSVENHVRNSESGDYAISTDLVRILW